MPRPKLINPNRSWQVRLPEDLMARVLSDLFSDAEGCVPYGAQSKFIEQCIREHYERYEQSRIKAESTVTCPSCLYEMIEGTICTNCGWVNP